LHISEFGADEFQIKQMGQLKGGGVVGTWLGSAAGYASAHAATSGICAIIATPFYIVNPVVGAAVFVGVSKAAHVLVQPIAYSAAIAGGIAGGVATGPL
jgi:hypothetical protein